MDHPAQDRLMELVPHGSRHGPWISSVFLAAEYNALAAYPGRSAQEQIELIRSIESDLGDIERRLKQVPDADSDNFREVRRSMQERRGLELVRHDLQVILSSARALAPATSQVARERANSQSNQGSGGCYIATAVYGSYDHGSVMVLRRWRDERLAASWQGRLFISIYYRLSPVVARSVLQAPWAARRVRAALDRLVCRLERTASPSEDYRATTRVRAL